jgi:hypothetical protein
VCFCRYCNEQKLIPRMNTLKRNLRYIMRLLTGLRYAFSEFFFLAISSEINSQLWASVFCSYCWSFLWFNSSSTSFSRLLCTFKESTRYINQGFGSAFANPDPASINYAELYSNFSLQGGSWSRQTIKIFGRCIETHVHTFMYDYKKIWFLKN